MQIITLLTDFGTADVYVAQMKAVILQAVPNCQIIDVTHHIAPQNVSLGARALRDASMLFPQGTIHIAVVDPGVGSDRRIVAAKINHQIFILPDNGLLSEVLRDFPLQQAVALTESRFWRPTISNTFHGRDIMAAVAGHLASGTQLSELGPTISDLKKLDALASRGKAQAFQLKSFPSTTLATRSPHCPANRSPCSHRVLDCVFIAPRMIFPILSAVYTELTVMLRPVNRLR